ncbi:metallophosphoesterase [bacterium]|nr:metallophosphoesterase [bacterium]
MTKNISILFYSDTHLGFDYPVRPRIERRRRGDDFFGNHYRVLEHALQSKVDMVVHGGDLFFRTRVPNAIVDKVYDGLLDFAENGIPLIIIPGNHESSRLPGSILIEHPNVYIFKKPQRFNFNISGARVAVSGFPYIRHNIRDRFREVLGKIESGDDDSDLRLLCMHQVVEGAQVGPANFKFRHGENVIRVGDLPGNYHAILSGHIHRVQVLWTGSKPGVKPVPVIYPGSVGRTSFAEKDEEKGFFMLKFSRENGKWTLKPPRFHKLETRPMVDVTIGLDSIDRSKIRLELRRILEGIDENAIVRLHFEHGRTRRVLSAQLLREVVPPSMNLQLKGGWKNMDKNN